MGTRLAMPVIASGVTLVVSLIHHIRIIRIDGDQRRWQEANHRVPSHWHQSLLYLSQRQDLQPRWDFCVENSMNSGDFENSTLEKWPSKYSKFWCPSYCYFSMYSRWSMIAAVNWCPPWNLTMTLSDFLVLLQVVELPEHPAIAKENVRVRSPEHNLSSFSAAPLQNSFVLFLTSPWFFDRKKKGES